MYLDLIYIEGAMRLSIEALAIVVLVRIVGWGF